MRYLAQYNSFANEIKNSQKDKRIELINDPANYSHLAYTVIVYDNEPNALVIEFIVGGIGPPPRHTAFVYSSGGYRVYSIINIYFISALKSAINTGGQKMKPLVVLLISVSLTSIGQLILKKGMLAVGAIEKLGIKFLQMLVNPLVMLGVAFAILGWVAYAMALSKSELSYAYPIWSLTYVIVPLLSLFIFKESISLLKMGGLGFICLGVCLVVVSVK